LTGRSMILYVIIPCMSIYPEESSPCRRYPLQVTI
jgi:hypothetical protein